MLDKVRELYCECDEYLGEINLVTGITILEKCEVMEEIQCVSFAKKIKC